MGDSSANAETYFHIQGGTFIEVKYRHHHGQQSIDTSQAVTPTQFADLHSAAQTSQAAFETAASAAMGSGWWSARPQGVRDAFFKMTLGMDPSGL